MGKENFSRRHDWLLLYHFTFLGRSFQWPQCRTNSPLPINADHITQPFFLCLPLVGNIIHTQGKIGIIFHVSTRDSWNLQDNWQTPVTTTLEILRGISPSPFIFLSFSPINSWILTKQKLKNVLNIETIPYLFSKEHVVRTKFPGMA